ncbi:MAG: hypothetical protein ACC700_17165 [Anaerolineales bacterium]
MFVNRQFMKEWEKGNYAVVGAYLGSAIDMLVFFVVGWMEIQTDIRQGRGHLHGDVLGDVLFILFRGLPLGAIAGAVLGEVVKLAGGLFTVPSSKKGNVCDR